MNKMLLKVLQGEEVCVHAGSGTRVKGVLHDSTHREFFVTQAVVEEVELTLDFSAAAVARITTEDGQNPHIYLRVKVTRGTK